MEAMSAETENLYLSYADRTSSFQALHPSFKSFKAESGNASIRYVERGKAWIGATEPFAEPGQRMQAIRDFFDQATRQKKRATILPVSAHLSQASVISIPGCERVQVGSEPIFDLKEQFGQGKDPIFQIHRARALKRRGAQIEHHFGSRSLSETTKETLNLLAESWHEGLRTHSLGFLNRVDLWDRADSKHFFILRHEGRLGGLLTAVPLSGRPGAYYFADVIRAAGSKAGTIELLMIEAMRSLYEKHSATEVRLGLCPLSLIHSDPLAEKTARLRWTQTFLHWLGQKNTPIYGFRSAFEFKSKLGPSRWEPLYLLSSGPIGLPTAMDVQAAHFDTHESGGFLAPWLEGIYRKKLKEPLRTLLREPTSSLPNTFSEASANLRITWSVAALLLALHIWKSSTATGTATFAAAGYQVNAPSFWGWWMGPLFHNHHYHFAGDFLSFLFFGTLLEWISTRRFYLGVTAFGLWLTNPISHLLVWITSLFIQLPQYDQFLQEVDYGSSNAIYAFVGALSYQIKKPAILLLPFAANGIYLCLAKNSWLSLHHLVALLGGWWIAKSLKKD